MADIDIHQPFEVRLSSYGEHIWREYVAAENERAGVDQQRREREAQVGARLRPPVPRVLELPFWELLRIFGPAMRTSTLSPFTSIETVAPIPGEYVQAHRRAILLDRLVRALGSKLVGTDDYKAPELVEDTRQIRDIPANLEHLALGHELVNAPGASPARIVWFCLWTYRRSDGLAVFPGDPRLAGQACIGVRQLQAALRCLESHGRIERRKQRRGRASTPKRVIQLRPRVEPAGDRGLHLPSLTPLQVVCARGRERPHVDMAVMLGLYLVALECRVLHSGDQYSGPFAVTWTCLADLLGLGRNTPRRCIDRLGALDLVRPTHEGDDWSSGLRVARPERWFALANRGSGR